MKYLIVSDIHGSVNSANIIKEKFEILKCDKILLLGDILYHGPRNDLPNNYAPKQVISVLNPLKEYIIAVRGNCDAEVDQMVLDFKINEDYSFNYNDKHIYYLQNLININHKNTFHLYIQILNKYQL